MVSRTSQRSDQPVARPLHTHTEQHKQNKHTQTPMPQVGFKPMISMFELAKTVNVLDCATTVIGSSKEKNALN
jgi:hypothetical protein